MASYNTNQYIDTLTVNNIFTKGANNTNIPAFRVLMSDGNGGTVWSGISSLQYGGAFHTIKTSVGTYDADQAQATFSLLDGPNVGLINDPTASNTAYLYAKAFGRFDISGGNSILSYNPDTNTVNNDVLFVGTGGITIKGDPQTNTMFFDGRELPFVSTLPYAFNQTVVYSNVPLDTLIASTSKSIIIQAKSPSSILSFVGEDLVVIDTNYASNQIQIKLSTLTQSNVSTLFTEHKIGYSTFVTKVELSTFSTTYGELLSYTNFQNSICTMSTNIDYKTNYNSTIIGNVETYSRGISTVWRTFVREQFITNSCNTSNLVSTTASLTTAISSVQNQVVANLEILTASTIITPHLIASTLVTLNGVSIVDIPTPVASIGPLNVRYYPLYSSFYNVFNDGYTTGNPVTPPIYPTSIDVTTGNFTISTVSTVSNTLFSSMFALKGTFVFYPNDQIQPFSLNWVGNLTLNINNKECLTPPIPYPNANTFGNQTFTSNITGYPITVVNFTYSKVNPTDYITFSNFRDYVSADQSFSVAPIYPAYGYDIRQTPIYTQVINKYPAYFSSPSNLVGSPFRSLSSYVMIASTIYTSGANTTFPLTASGYTSVEFLEQTTGIEKYGIRPNLSNGPSQYSSNNALSASNTFGYDFNTRLPVTPYTMQLVYAHQNSDEILEISSLYKTVQNFTYTSAVYISSLLYASNISSYSAQIQNLQISTINGVVFTGDNTSSLSSIYNGLNGITSTLGLNINQFSATLIDIGGLVLASTTVGGIDSVTSNLSTNVVKFSTTIYNYGIVSSFTGRISGESTLSTNYAGVRELTCTMSTNVSQYGSVLFNYGVLSSFTGLGRISGESTLSTNYAGVRLLTCSLSTNVRNFSTVEFNYGVLSSFTGLGRISGESTLSTNFAGISLLTCSLSTNVRNYSSVQFNYGMLSSFTGLGHISGESTLSTNFAGIRLLTCSLSTNVRNFSTAEFNYGILSSFTGLGRISGESTLSTNFAGIRLLTCSISTNVRNYSTNGFDYGILSSYITVNVNGLNNASTLSTTYGFTTQLLCSFSTAISINSPDNRAVSTTYAGVRELTCTLSTNVRNYSSFEFNYGVVSSFTGLGRISGESTLSTNYAGVRQLTCSLSTNVRNYSSVQFNYGALSSYTGLGFISGESTLSTTYAGLKNVENSISANITRFSTGLQAVLASTTTLRINNLFTSTITSLGVQQPFIQHGIINILGPVVIGVPNVVLPIAYSDRNYCIQLTYSNETTSQVPITQIIYATNVTSSNFSVFGTQGKKIFWTTFGNVL
jgi:hypothetical protein